MLTKLLHILALGLFVGWHGATASATPLDAQTCDTATAEKATLADIPHLMERGAEWAKAKKSQMLVFF